MVTTEQKRAIFEELTDILRNSQQGEDEITVKEYAEYCRKIGEEISNRKAYSILIRAVENGIMTRRKVLSDCHWIWVFRRTNEKAADSS